MTRKEIQSKADRTRSINTFHKGSFLYKIASAMIKEKGYYTYHNPITDEKVFVTN